MCAHVVGRVEHLISSSFLSIQLLKTEPLSEPETLRTMWHALLDMPSISYVSFP